MAGFTQREKAGYTGKEVELWVKRAADEDDSSFNDTTNLKKIRGAQNFNPTEEQAETKVSEMGFAAQKTIYGTINYSVSTTLLIRDLVQIARLAGINDTTAKKLNISKFAPINAINWIKDPDDSTKIVSTILSLGYKPRTANKTMAVEANSQITMDGKADLVVTVDNKAWVRQYNGKTATVCPVNGVNYCFIIDSTEAIGVDNILAVENPAGELIEDTAYSIAQYGGVSYLQLTAIPESDTIVRIVFSKPSDLN